MKITVPLVNIVVLLACYTGIADAGTLWNNGAPTSASTNCDSTPDVCHGNLGNPGWTVYDDFQTSQDVTVTGFDYDSDFSLGSTSDYISTNWSIWEGDPFSGDTVIASGNVEATLSVDNSGTHTTEMFTVSGIFAYLPNADTYFLGYENVLQNDGAKTIAVISNGSQLTGHELTSDDNAFQFPEGGNTVFAVQGDLGLDAPETSTWSLLAIGGGLLAVAKRRRRTRLT